MILQETSTHIYKNENGTISIYSKKVDIETLEVCGESFLKTLECEDDIFAHVEEVEEELRIMLNELQKGGRGDPPNKYTTMNRCDDVMEKERPYKEGSKGFRNGLNI